MLALIPQPQKLKELTGRFDTTQPLFTRIASPEFEDAAAELYAVLHRSPDWQGRDAAQRELWLADRVGQRRAAAARLFGMEDPGTKGRETVCFEFKRAKNYSKYRLLITPERITITSGSAVGAHNAVQTVRQLFMQSAPGTLPCVEIEDWPDFAQRGVYYDLSRGRVPKPDALYAQTRLLSSFKLNQLQLYIEHTFQFKRHPAIGAGCSPLSAQFVTDFDEYCRERHVELVPSLACFGHMSKLLSLPPYRHLAEDWGEGRYLDPAAKIEGFEPGWSLAPANEESYTFLRELFEEFLPCFHSGWFNVCCDETYDLGWGQSYELAQRIGKGRLYLQHLLRLCDLARDHGRSIMFWGDIIRGHPELIDELPYGAAVLDWGYDARMDFKRIRDFTATGLASYVCPTVSGYVTLFPRLHESLGNIAGWARAGKQHGAAGLLNTDWGDGGHYNFTELSWPGYLFGAEQAWNASADRDSFLTRFAQLFLGIDRASFVEALVSLGDVAQTAMPGFYQSFWRHVFFARPGDAVLAPALRPASLSEGGRIRDGELAVNAALGRAVYDQLDGIGEEFAHYTDNARYDPHEVLTYWAFAVDTLKHAARKLAVLGEDGADSAAARRELRAELGALRERFEALWLQRNERSEIGITLGYYDRALQGLDP